MSLRKMCQPILTTSHRRELGGGDHERGGRKGGSEVQEVYKREQTVTNHIQENEKQKVRKFTLDGKL